jgi:fructosamine-3-kinase
MQKTYLSGNSEATIYIVDDDDRRYILKESENDFLLESEAHMLEHLRPHIRVPDVLFLEPGGLGMEYIPNDGHCNNSCETEIADALARLHNQNASTFGFECDTTIGPFRQHNTPNERWIDFYREMRVVDFAHKCYTEGRIGTSLLKRIETFAASFETYLEEPEQPSLLHGDIWSGNVLSHNNRFAALIDPAVYYGHFEMELAFIGMFNTFGDTFYGRYSEHRRIRPGFFESRAHIYRIFPYLVHVRSFGNSYIGGLEAILKRFGY